MPIFFVVADHSLAPKKAVEEKVKEKEDDSSDEEIITETDEALQAMLGFGGFGTTKVDFSTNSCTQLTCS